MSAISVRSPSLRRSLLLWLLWPLLVIAPAAVALQYMLTLKPALRAFDHSLGATVLSIGNFILPGPQSLQFEMTAQTERSIRTDQTDAIFYVVTDPRGELLAGDPGVIQCGTRRVIDHFLQAILSHVHGRRMNGKSEDVGIQRARSESMIVYT